MNILVTGATGYFGAAIVKELLTNKKNYVIALVRDSEKFSKLRQWCSADNNQLMSFEGDVCNLNTLPGEINTIIHAAGIIESTAGVNQEYLIRINTEGTSNILQLAKQHKIKQFIFISSQLVYGTENPPWSETDKVKPYGMYGNTKYEAEKLVCSYKYSIDYMILRMTRLYGVSLFMRWSEVIAKFCRLIFEGKPILVYGDGNQRYDVVHVNDAARITRILLEKHPTGWNDVYNIGGGKSISINNLVQELRIVSEILGLRPLEIVQYPDKIDSRPKHLELDISKIQEKFGWKPEVPFSEGLKEYFTVLQGITNYKIYL